MRHLASRPRRMVALSVALTALFLNTAATAADEIRSTLEDQKEVAVTIYNGDLALVKDLRNVKLQRGSNRLAFREVSARIKPETALLRSVTNPDGFRLIEQNFDYDVLSPGKLLEKYLGKTVRVATINPATGDETFEEASVLSVESGVVLRIGDRIETGHPGRVVFDNVPANLRDQPTLVIELESGTNRSQDVQLSYLTGGLSWQADYIAELDESDRFVDLTGWVTLTNQSGVTYANAKLQLVAGDVNQVTPRAPARMRALNQRAAGQLAQEVAEEGLFEYHLYTMPNPTTIANNQNKQVSLLSAARIPVKKQYLVEGVNHFYRGAVSTVDQKQKVMVYIEFANDEKSNLGMPMPKGIVRVYKDDKSGRAQFVGEDRVDHTPKNEDVRLRLGDAFDLTAVRNQTKFETADRDEKGLRVDTLGHEIEIRNAKDEAVEVVIREPIPGDWKMQRESHPHRKVAANAAEWKVPVPAEGRVKLSYEVVVRR